MQITLDHIEILKALDDYVRTLIDIKPNQSIAIAMKAGRLENGFSATLDIVTTGAALAPAHAYPETIQAGEAAQAQTNSSATSTGSAEVVPVKKAGVFNKPKAVVTEPEPEAVVVPKAAPFPNARRSAAPDPVPTDAGEVDDPDLDTETVAEESPEDTGPIEIAPDLEDEPGSEETQPEPVAEAAPVKKSIFSKAS